MRLMKTSTLEITRDTGDGYWDDKGRWVDDSTPLIFTIDGNSQPFRLGDKQVILPEGVSANDARVVRSKVLLNTSDQFGDKKKADTTVINGLVYEAFFVEDWNSYGLKTDHYKTTFIKKDLPSNGSL